MHELRAHPIRLLTILVAGLVAFTTTYAVGSYGDETATPTSASTPAASATIDPSQPPVVETPTPSPSGTAPTGTTPSGSGSGGDEPAAPAPTGQADEPAPTRQPAEHTTAPAPDEPEPGPATSTYVAPPDDQATHTCGPIHDEVCH